MSLISPIFQSNTLILGIKTGTAKNVMGNHFAVCSKLRKLNFPCSSKIFFLPDWSMITDIFIDP